MGSLDMVLLRQSRPSVRAVNEVDPDVALEEKLIGIACLWVPLALVAIFTSWHAGRIPLRIARFVLPKSFWRVWQANSQSGEILDSVDVSSDEDATLQEQLSSEHDESSEDSPMLIKRQKRKARRAPWTLVVLLIAALQVSILVAAEAYRISVSGRHTYRTVTQLGQVLLWVFVLVRLLFARSHVAPLDVFVLIGISLFGTLLQAHNEWFLSIDPSVVKGVTLLVSILAQVLALLSIAQMPLTKRGIVPNAADGSIPLSSLPSPEDGCTLGDWMTFRWLNPLIHAAKSKGYLEEENDIYRIAVNMRSAHLSQNFDAIGKSMPESSVLNKVLYANATDLGLDLSLTIVSSILAYAAPFFLRRILQVIEAENAGVAGSNTTPDASLMTVLLSGPRPGNASQSMAYMFAVFAFCSTMLRSQADMQHLYYARRACIRVRSQLMSAIYMKGLRKKDTSGVAEDDEKTQKKKQKGKDDESAMKQKGLGAAVSLMAADSVKISVIANRVSQLFTAPVEIMIAITFLYSLLGWSAFAGVAVVTIAVPLQAALTRRSMRITRSLGALLDKRMAAISELISNLKTIRFIAWEQSFVDRIIALREREIASIWRRQIFSTCTSALWAFVPNAITVVSFASYTILARQTLTVSTAFTALNIFNMLSGPLNNLPSLLNEIATVLVAFQRIESFLEEDEVPAWVSGMGKSNASPSSCSLFNVISVKDATFRWNVVLDKGTKEISKKHGTFYIIYKSLRTAQKGVNTKKRKEAVVTEDAFHLRDVTCNIPIGCITLICGPTASGKSSFLHALLGEMDLVRGDLAFGKDPALQNVAFCAQSPWLQFGSIRSNILFGSRFDRKRYIQVLHACGLLTDLALFSNGDEEEVGEGGVILSGGQKARIALARALYSSASTVLMDDVLAAVDANTQRLLVREALAGPLMHSRTLIIATHHHALLATHVSHVIRLDGGKIARQGKPSEVFDSEELEGESQLASPTLKASELMADALEGVMMREKGFKAKGLFEKEQREKGRVRWEIYAVFFKNAGFHLVALVLLCVSAHKASEVLNQFWLSTWAESYNRPGGINRVGIHLPSAGEDVRPYISIYFLIGVLITSLSVVTSLTSSFAGVRAMRRIFDGMLSAVLRATSRWLDTQPSGRLTNRFSKDVATIATSLPGNFRNVAYQGIGAFGSVLVLSTTLPAYLVPAAILLYGYLRAAQDYNVASRELRRIESTTRSPIFTSYSEVLRGIVTVRAFCAEDRLLQKLHGELDYTLAAFNFFWQMTRWLFLRFDALGATSVFAATLFALNTSKSAGLAAIAISQAQSFSNNLFWTTRSYTSLEQDLTSMERSVQMLPPNIPAEQGQETEPPALPPRWPSKLADIVFDKVTMRYAPALPRVLDEVSIRIEPNEKVGICGRTGSGKSTLAMSLLRPVELSSGSITIEGRNISKVGLNELRSRIGLVSQDPMLFGGTVRDNLDPFHTSSDEECLEALMRVKLSSAVEEGGHGVTLGTMLSEGGANLSAGQRQLLAIARVILRENSIVIADEATASVDLVTDQHIQEVMRSALLNTTLLTIGHRLQTIIDYDKILLMDKGRVAEFDTPRNLLLNRDSMFHRMCRASGDYHELLRRAVGEDDAARVLAESQEEEGEEQGQQ